MENNIAELKKKKLYLFDMDGTIYLDDKLFDGTKELLGYIKKMGGRYVFITNNSSRSVRAYVSKVNKLGVDALEEDFLTSADATIMYLKEKRYRKIYVFGTESFKEQLREARLPISDIICDDIDCLCMGFDTELTFQKLEDACILLNEGIDYIATNPDLVCPTSYGYVPDCGSVSEMLYNATKRKPHFIGKPKPDIIETAINKTGFKKEETVVVGDRLYTDIAGGVNAGVSTIFVLSGEGTIEDIEKFNIQPEFIFDNVKEVYESLCQYEIGK